MGSFAILVVPAVTMGGLLGGLALAHGQTQLYGYRLAVAAALSLVALGLVAGLIARAMARAHPQRTLALGLGLLGILLIAIPRMDSMDPVFYEVVIAPDYEPAALEILQKKK